MSRLRRPGATCGWRRVRGDDEAGNAIVEFVFLAVLLMVPLVYVLLTVFRVQSAAYAASSAAREAGRVFATSESVDGAGGRAFAAARDRDGGQRPAVGRGRPADHLLAARRACSPGSRVEVVVAYDVSLPLLPRFLDGRRPRLSR